jgi:hypothetical protein
MVKMVNFVMCILSQKLEKILLQKRSVCITPNCIKLLAPAMISQISSNTKSFNQPEIDTSDLF